MDARLGAARDDDVRVAAPDQLGGFADRVRPGRTRRDGGVVRARAARARSRSGHWPCRRARSGGSTATRGRSPRSRRTSACATIPMMPPIAEPKRIPARVGFDALDARVRPAPPARRRPPAARCARAGAPPSADDRSGSKPFTSAAIRTGNPVGSNARIQSTPLRPATAASHVTRVEPERRDRSEPCDRNATPMPEEPRSLALARLTSRSARARRASGRPRRRDPVPADGGRARSRAARRRRLAVRAEVGRLQRHARERVRRAPALVAKRAAAPALLPGAAPAR